MDEAESVRRRLRFDLDLRDDESIPGAVARAARWHVLHRTAPVLEAADIPTKRLGVMQIASPAELTRLAEVIRCDPHELIRRGGERCEETSGANKLHARFGRLVLPRAFLELRRRRLAPRSLRIADHHRLSWLNLLLPYCPESLERIVDHCAACGAHQGWHAASGIGICDACGKEIAPSEELGLPDELTDDYRFFARLSSPDIAAIELACKSLPDTLSQASPSTLLRLALHLGGLCRDQSLVTASRHVVVELPRDILASVGANGVSFLKTWPTGFQSWALSAADKLNGDRGAFEILRKRLRRLVDRQREDSELVDLVAQALPDLRKHSAHSFSINQRYYLYRETRRRLRLSAAQIETLKTWPGLKMRRLPRSVNEHCQFDADQIDEIEQIAERMIPINACQGRLGLPLYAIEELCHTDILDWEDHPAITLTKPWHSIRRASVKDLEERLLSAARKEDTPSDAVPLSRAVKRIGGRPKPWAAIMAALCERRLPYWLGGNLATPTNMLVRPSDLAFFDQHFADDGKLPRFPRDEHMSQLDTAEMLNLTPKVLAKDGRKIGLPFVPKGRALVVDKARVLSIARSTAWPAEIAWHVGDHPLCMEHILKKAGIPPVSNGWCRKSLIAAKILPTI